MLKIQIRFLIFNLRMYNPFMVFFSTKFNWFLCGKYGWKMVTYTRGVVCKKKPPTLPRAGG
jgi:hypothetical protein